MSYLLRKSSPSLADKERVSRLIERMNFSRCTPTARERFQEELAVLFSGKGFRGAFPLQRASQ